VKELTAGLGAAQRAIDNGIASDDVLRFAEAAKQELQTRNDSSINDAVASEPSRGGERKLKRRQGNLGGRRDRNCSSRSGDILE
jgi:predicted aminopeptidase